MASSRSIATWPWPSHRLLKAKNVAAGEKLGVVGRNGVTVGTHVYFEMDFAGKPVDPAPYLRAPLEYPDAMVRFIKRQMTDRIQKARLSEGGSTI